MPDLTQPNFGLLAPQTSTPQNSVNAQAQGAPISGGQPSSGLGAPNAVSIANRALTQTMGSTPPAALAASLLGVKPPQGGSPTPPMGGQAPQASGPTATNAMAQPAPSGLLTPLTTGAKPTSHDLSNILDPTTQHMTIDKATQAAGQPGATPYDVAQSYLGEGRQQHADTMEAFIKKSTGGNVNIQNTPWCAAFANSVLMSTGHGGTGSLAAQSFLNYGRSTSTPSQGDVVVVGRGGPNSGLGHVGFFAGYSDDHTKVKILGGNTAGKVGVSEYPLGKVLDYRTPPSAEELKAKAQNPNMKMASTENPNTPNDQVSPPVMTPQQYEGTAQSLDQGGPAYE